MKCSKCWSPINDGEECILIGSTLHHKKCPSREDIDHNDHHQIIEELFDGFIECNTIEMLVWLRSQYDKYHEERFAVVCTYDNCSTFYMLTDNTFDLVAGAIRNIEENLDTNSIYRIVDLKELKLIEVI